MQAVVGFKFLKSGSLNLGLANKILSHYHSLQRQPILFGLIYLQLESVIFVLPTGIV